MSTHKISYTLTKEDFLQHLLYADTKNKAIQTKRFKGKILLPILYVIIGVVGFVSGYSLLMLFMLAFALIWWVIYPKWEKNHYKKLYSQFLDKEMSQGTSKQISLEITPEQIFQKEDNVTYSIAYDQINVCHENGQYIYLGLKDGYTLIIPKRELADAEELKNSIFNNSKGIEIPQVTDLNWKW